MHKSGREQTVLMGTPEENNFKTQAWMDGWMDTIETDLQEIWLEKLEWIYLAQNEGKVAGY